MEEKKRLFFGLEVLAPWPASFPSGRLLDESCRHLTLAFLGETDFSKMQRLLSSVPTFSRPVGFTGQFDSCLFLPKRHPHVVAWHVNWLQKEDEAFLEAYQKTLIDWLKKHEFPVDEKDHFLPHVTLCRSPFSIGPWKHSFQRLPLMTLDLHLYESLGRSRYQPCWSLRIKKPFEEIEHTADIAFKVKGQNLMQLYQHGLAALSFKFPPLLDYFNKPDLISDLDDVIICLNEATTRADVEIGCPFKAISFHGNLIEEKDGLLTWEMIVDV